MGGFLSNEPEPIYVPRQALHYNNSWDFEDSSRNNRPIFSSENSATNSSTLSNNRQSSLETSARITYSRITNSDNYLTRSLSQTSHASSAYTGCQRRTAVAPSPSASRSNYDLFQAGKKLSQTVASRCNSTLNWSLDYISENSRETLEETDPQFVKIRQSFRKTMHNPRAIISKIVRVQNPYLMGQYMLKKMEMKNRYRVVTEQLLFHGTKKENVDEICRENFDWRKHSRCLFGQGVSFSPKPSYASCYCDKKAGEKVMMVAKVLIAATCEGNPEMILPYYYDFRRQIRCDSSKKQNGDVIVKYYDDEYYPAYIVYFKVAPKKTATTVTTTYDYCDKYYDNYY